MKPVDAQQFTCAAIDVKFLDCHGPFQDLEELIAASGYVGPVIFASSYAAATVLLFPASLLTLAAGYLFGPVKGTALVSVSATGGACLAFLVSRYLARPAVEAKLAEYPKFQTVYDGISKDGAKLVLLLRLSPLIPFSLLNYFLGVTKVGFTEYALASWLGMLPGEQRSRQQASLSPLPCIQLCFAARRD
eukprot:gene6553-6781_t